MIVEVVFNLLSSSSSSKGSGHSAELPPCEIWSKEGWGAAVGWKREEVEGWKASERERGRERVDLSAGSEQPVIHVCLSASTKWPVQSHFLTSCMTASINPPSSCRHRGPNGESEKIILCSLGSFLLIKSPQCAGSSQNNMSIKTEPLCRVASCVTALISVICQATWPHQLSSILKWWTDMAASAQQRRRPVQVMHRWYIHMYKSALTKQPLNHGKQICDLLSV